MFTYYVKTVDTGLYLVSPSAPAALKWTDDYYDAIAFRDAEEAASAARIAGRNEEEGLQIVRFVEPVL
jgi:hypothetical protein